MRIEDAGFSVRDLELEHGSVPVDILQLLTQTSQTSQPVPESQSEGIRASLPEGSDGSKPMNTNTDSDAATGIFNSSSPTEDAIRKQAADIQAIKDRKQEYRAGNNADPALDTDYVLNLIFKTSADKEKFLAKNNFPARLKHITVEEIIPLMQPGSLWRE